MSSSLRRWPKEDEDQVYMYILTTSHVTSGRLVNLFLDLIEASQANILHMQSFKRYIQACLSLSLLYCLRILEHECIVRGIDIRDVGDSIMYHSHTTFQLAKDACDTSKREDREALLWISFIGTIYELKKTDGSILPYSNNTHDTFLRSLQEIAGELGICSFTDLKELSEHFFYTEYLLPKPASVFDAFLTK